MSTNVTKSYLDLARAVIDTQVGSKENACRDDAIFALMSCTYVYSYSALLSFCSAQLYQIWAQESSELRERHPNCESFEQLMAGPLKEIKCAIKELSLLKGISPIHKSDPKLWQNLNEFLKNYRDFFLHPNPELFESFVGKVGNAQWQLPSRTASGILAYIFKEENGSIPHWVTNSGLKAHGFEITSL
jgi:hypothetical protein